MLEEGLKSADTAERQKEIPQQYEIQVGLLEDITEALNRLQDAIEPILLLEPEQAPKELEEAGCNTVVSGQMFTTNQCLRIFLSRIRSMTSRAEA